MYNFFKNLFNKVFKKGYLNKPITNFKPVIIDPDGEHIHNALGVTEERVKEITLFTKLEETKPHTNLPELIEREMPNLKHPNEVFLFAMVLGAYTFDKQQSKSRNAMIKDLLNKLKDLD